MVCNEQLREEFVTLHGAVEEILKVRGLHSDRKLTRSCTPELVQPEV